MSGKTASDKTDASEKPSLYSISGDMNEDKKFLEPIICVLQVSKKDERTQLIKAFNHWLQISAEKLEAIIEIMHVFYIMNILIDDLECNSILRRGRPVVRSIYGTAHTISAANYTLIILMEKVLSLGHPEAIKIYVQLSLEFYKGQTTGTYWKHNYICPTEIEYEKMTIKKTSGFFKMAVQLMQLFSKCKEDFKPLIETLGLCFQIYDDYCNFYTQECSDNISYCEHLSDANLNFPVVHAIQSCPDNVQLMNLVKQQPRDNKIKCHCVNLLKKFDSFNYTRKTLENLDKKARVEIKLLGGNLFLETILDKWLKNIKNCDKL